MIWFNTLDHNRLCQIDELTKEFIEEFTKSGIKHNTVGMIHTFKQAEKESVKDAANRFKEYITRCPTPELST